MPVTFLQIFVVCVVIFLVIALYKELFNPAFTFFISVVALLLVGAITPQDVLKGLSNLQIVIIFLLILVTAGIRLVFSLDFFTKIFSLQLSPRAFLARMMIFVSAISAFLNNTPIVAFMIPYVRDWAARTGNSGSKFLIPLSFATMLGGMITVIGTSTNLVLAGLAQEYNQPAPGFTDFLFLGLIVTVSGTLYLYFIGYHLLPSYKDKIENLKEHIKEYIVEIELFKGSHLIGKTVEEAGLRHLKDVFLVEIIRKDTVISPVSPATKLEENDSLFFSGNTQSIFDLIREENGLQLPRQKKIESSQQFNFVEAVIPASSGLIGIRIKDSDFRKEFNSSIIAIHRNGKRVPGRVGETVLAGGDFLLLLSGGDLDPRMHEKELFFISTPKHLPVRKPSWYPWLGGTSFIILVGGVAGLIPLFTSCMLILTAFVLFGVLTASEIKRNLDFSLLLVLVSSLAVGIALERSGAGSLIAYGIIQSGNYAGNAGVIGILFIFTIFLTSLITNAAAVSIMFPIALSLSEQTGVMVTPFFVAIAFGASGDFMTPIGYQTNLMIYGPGGYTFRDFVRVGAPLTLLYTIICLLFILLYYNLI